jgi:hypothetical protein
VSGHKTGDGILKRVIALEDERETLHAHLRAIVANPDPDWTGWRHALEMLIPDSEPRLDELQDELRTKGMDTLADRLVELRSPPDA